MRRENDLVKIFPQYLTGEDLFGLSDPTVLKIIESVGESHCWLTFVPHCCYIVSIYKAYNCFCQGVYYFELFFASVYFICWFVCSRSQHMHARAHTRFLFNQPFFPELFQVRLQQIMPFSKSKLLGIVVAKRHFYWPDALPVDNQQHQSTEGWRCIRGLSQKFPA